MAQVSPPSRERSVPPFHSFEDLTQSERPSSTPATKVHSVITSSNFRPMTPPDSVRVGAAPTISVTQPDMQDPQVISRPQTEDDVFGDSEPLTGGAHAQTNLLPSPESKPMPRLDRLSAPITASNAQGLLPPEACVFVANLHIARTDEQLEQTCHTAFDQFGQCVIKVRRDKHNHPFALVQFHRVEDANEAVKYGSNLVIDGRKVRTEHAQARRTVVLTHRDGGGGAITHEEALNLLDKYGPISHMQPTTHRDARIHGVPEGMWVQFAYYLDYKDALKAFNQENRSYKISDPPTPNSRVQPVVQPIPGIPQAPQAMRNARSTTDQKSIFIGNLPDNVEEEEIRNIFRKYGEIVSVNVIRKPISGGSGYNIFGFVEFADSHQAEIAAEAEVDIHDQRIRVEPKEYSARKYTRLRSYAPPANVNGGPIGRLVGWQAAPSFHQYDPVTGYVVQQPSQQYYLGHPATIAAYQEADMEWIPVPYPTGGHRNHRRQHGTYHRSSTYDDEQQWNVYNQHRNTGRYRTPGYASEEYTYHR